MKTAVLFRTENKQRIRYKVFGVLAGPLDIKVTKILIKRGFIKVINRGELVGYRVSEFTPEGKAEKVISHNYLVLCGKTDPKTGLMANADLVTVKEKTQVLKELKKQSVEFESTTSTFDGKEKTRYFNITAV